MSEAPSAIVLGLLGSVLGGCLLLASTDGLSRPAAPAPPGDAGRDASGDGGSGETTSDGGAVAVATGPSCKNLPTTCGPRNDQNCCASGVVPGGAFSRNYDNYVATDSSFHATVSAFRMDAYEVTVGRFRAFVNAYEKPKAGSGKNPNNPLDQGWRLTWNNALPQSGPALGNFVRECRSEFLAVPGSNPGEETLPIGCITWFEAFAFCIWDGGRLPTDAEWYFAAAGGSEQRVYPWSQPPNSRVVDRTYGAYLDDPLKSVGFASPKGDSKWGASDMFGNAFEWVVDYAGPLPKECRDCANLATGDRRMSRGGSISKPLQDIHIALPNDDPPDIRWHDIGMRCVRAP